ncbi:hypothetical protein DEA98_14235 [Brucella pseudogrignonensis]|uniref:CASP-like protein n=1 Tax=Brucella pseudogrignonensis TaxID=419475 RepID=A0A7Y3WWR3_9HYPH|nr:hypothetical protein [Brucella pseudogrignonensis]MCM0752023.1 hypothetical protein [Brucella pseudogrignonensis]NNV20547.1 hypothetical protein [Brucella pseudogrignonensis]
MTEDERADSLEKASIDASVEGLKGLLILNGGACLSLLAFLSAVLASDNMSPRKAKFIAGATDALIYFAIAAGLSVVTCVFAYLANQSYSSHLRWKAQYPNHWRYGNYYTRGGLLSTGLSLGLFFFGVYSIWVHIS